MLNDSSISHFSCIAWLWHYDIMNSPSLPTRLHIVGECDIIWPDVILPLAEPEHPAQHPPRVNSHPHVQLHVRRVHHGPTEHNNIQWFGVSGDKTSSLTRWRLSCPAPSRRRSWRGPYTAPAARTRSSSSRPGSWYANTGCPAPQWYYVNDDIKASNHKILTMSGPLI